MKILGSGAPAETLRQRRFRAPEARRRLRGCSFWSSRGQEEPERMQIVWLDGARKRLRECRHRSSMVPDGG